MGKLRRNARRPGQDHIPRLEDLLMAVSSSLAVIGPDSGGTTIRGRSGVTYRRPALAAANAAWPAG